MARRSTRSTQQPDAITLAKANRFNRSALASNRQGRLTSSQILQFALRLVPMMLSVIVAIAFGIACIVLAAAVVPKEAFVANWLSFYRLYYASRSRRLVNIEPMPGNTNLEEERNA